MKAEPRFIGDEDRSNQEIWDTEHSKKIPLLFSDADGFPGVLQNRFAFGSSSVFTKSI